MKHRLLAIVGPTAVGKTDAAIELCLRLGGEVISGDSMQIYRGMTIGTAKPSIEERRGVVHHLVDIRDPDEPFSVAEFQSLVDAAVADIAGRGKLPVLVGGTGLYVRSVLQAYTFTEMEGDPSLRQELAALAEQHGPGYLHSRLMAVDPAAAAKLHPNDQRRLIRALEVYALTGQPISATQQAAEAAPRYDHVLIGLTADRTWLYDRIDRRVDLMLQQGWIDEMQALLRRFDHRLPAMQALGYKEIHLYLRGLLTEPEMRALIQRNTRRFAKRQLTWFRREREIHWIEVGPNRSTTKIVEETVKLLGGKCESV